MFKPAIIFPYINRIINIQLFLAVLFGFAIAIFPFIFPPLDWEDYSITFNGTWLLYNGYAPYADFGIPMGIGNFIMPYISFVLFGPGYNSLYIMQALEHCMLMYMTYLFFTSFTKDKQMQKLATGFTIVVLAIFVTFNVKAQFYNTEFLLFEISSFVFLLKAIKASDKRRKIWTSSLSAIMMFLCLQVKQDFGAFNFLIIISALVFYSVKQKQFTQLLTFIATLLVCVIIFIALVDMQQFMYWFNLGQAPHPKTNILMKLKASNWQSEYLIIILLMIADIALRTYSYGKDPARNGLVYFIPTIILCGFGIQNMITLSSSNFPYLIYSTAFIISSILMQVYWIFKRKGLAILVINSTLLLFIYLNKGQVYKAIYYFHPKGILMTSRVTEKSIFRTFGISRNFKSNHSDFVYCKMLLDSLHSDKNSPLEMANFTDLPFETEVPSQRIKGLPLWPDNNVLLFERERQRYLQLLEEQRFDVIFILELDFKGSSFTNKEFKSKALENYRVARSFPVAKYEDQRHISVLVKKSKV